MSPSDSVRPVALVGAGPWGLNWARTLHELGALGLVCDPSPAAQSEVRRRFPSVPTTASLADVLGDPTLTHVVVAAPAEAHFQLALQALRAQKHVLVEKPLCLRVEDGELLVQLAESVDRTLMVGHVLQYHPCIARVRELVQQGALGRLLTITSNRLNLGRFRKEEDALWSFAPHDISVILSLLGDQLPESLRCVGSASLRPEVVDSTLTVMRFTGDVTAQIHVSWLNPFKEQKLTIVGRDGMVVFDDTKPWSEKLTLYRDYLSWPHGEQPVPLDLVGERLEVPEVEPLRAECEHFLAVSQAGTAPRTDGREGLRVLRALELARRSLEQGGEAVTSAPREFFAHPTAVVEPGADVGAGTKVWHFAHVMRGARIGRGCNLGQGVHVASGAVLGDNVKVQNNVSVYAGVVLEDDVFLGPSCVLTNVKNPRSQVSRRGAYARTLLQRGASVGANATVVCGVTLGRYAFVAAGAVVTRDVPDYALVMGNPARQVGWMSRHGHRLRPDADGLMVCAESGLRYRELEPGVLRCLDLDEEAPLPPELLLREKSYDELKG